jgi:hypothetical protein
VRSASAILSPLPTCSRRIAASVLALLAVAGLAQAQDKPDCAGLIPRLDALIAEYYEAGEKAILTDDPGPAIDKARKRAMAGDAAATISMIGVGVALRGKKASFPVAMIRQICTYAERNGHPLHVATCAYFNALNPLGDRDAKHGAALAEITRFEGLNANTRPGVPSPDAYAGHISALKACLPDEPPKG